MEETKMPCTFYYYLHNILYEKYGERETSIKTIKECLFQWRIPKAIRPIIIKELEMFGLAERINNRTIKLKKSYFDKDDISKLYSNVGISY